MAPEIRIDNQKVGDLAIGSYFFVDRSPGEYTITLESRFEPGQFIARVKLAPGGVYYFEVAPRVTNGTPVIPALAGTVGAPINAIENSAGFQVNTLDGKSGAAIIGRLKG